MRLFYFIIFIIFIIAGCRATDTTTDTITLTAGPLTCEYKKKDLDESYDESTNVVIQCNGSSCSLNGNGATMADGILSISAAGTYIIKGTLNGQLRIEATENDYVHLILNSVTISSSSGPAIYGIAADKVTITLVGDSKLTDTTNYTVVDEEPDACLFVDADLSINGSGSISVTGNYGDAIRCKKDLRLISGKITVPTAIQKGIKAKNSLCIKDGTIDVTSTDSSIKVTRDDDAEKGYIVIDGGNISVSSGNDGIHAETHLTINGGYIDIKKSGEGLEGQMIDILGGEIHILSSDDGINASKISSSSENNNNMGFGGQSSSTGTDGSVYINIIGGKTYVTVQGNDADGIDSNGILYIGGDAEVYVSIQSGDIYGNMAALDAEGSNSIAEGATVIATAGGSGGGGSNPGGNPGGNSGGTHGGWNKRSHIIKDKEIYLSKLRKGKKLLRDRHHRGAHQNIINNPHDKRNLKYRRAMGGKGGMGGMGGMGGSETGSVYQAYLQTSVSSQSAGNQIIVKNSNGDVIVSYTPSVSYSSILATSPKMTAGETYTVVTGSTSQSVVASSGSSGTPNSPSSTSVTDDSKFSTSPSSPSSNGFLIHHSSILTYLAVFLSTLILLLF
ncbi:hypothetical protein H8356DRAFT_1647343 [Neocallimastix lanati (nom. inval.)]|jgi:hypothetical protein|nr:hypothetical protein H8356DRAFT_1647343 [Neocallimastix sp. JGI-2020a]